MSVPFGEPAILNDGRRVVAPWQTSGIYLGDEFHDGPQIRMPDAALTAAGNVWVVGKHQADGGASVWLDSIGLWWPVPYGVFGSRMILRANGEGCQIAFTTSATSWLCVKVTAGGSMSIASSGTIPSGEGGQGMRDWLLGTPRPMAPLDHALLGHQVRGDVTVGTVTLATALGPLPDQVVMAKGGKLGTLLQGGADWPTLRISPNEQFWVGAAYIGTKVVGGAVPAVVPALVTVTPVPPPPPPHGDFMEPWHVTFDESYSKVIARGVGAVAKVSIGNGIDVEWQKGADDTIHFAVYENGTLRNRSSLPRHVDVRG
jgi:hypothetical protein